MNLSEDVFPKFLCMSGKAAMTPSKEVPLVRRRKRVLAECVDVRGRVVFYIVRVRNGVGDVVQHG
jgi:hypothetical protein